MRASLQDALRRAALIDGVNITRPDVVFELADRVGLQMNRFAGLGSPQTRRLIREEHRSAARSRGVPSGSRQWIIAGR